MSLRFKLPLFMLVLTLLFTLATWAVQALVLAPSFAQLERDEARHDIMQVDNAVRREGEGLLLRGIILSHWNDTYQFMLDRSQAYRDENLADQSFVNWHLNLILVCDMHGAAVWGELHVEGRDAVPVEDVHRFLNISPASLKRVIDGGQDLRGIASTEAGPMLIAASAILRSDHTGPSRGAVIVGSIITQERLAGFAGIDTGNLSCWDVQKALPSDVANTSEKLKRQGGLEYEVLNDQQLCAFSLLKDVEGRPALIVREVFARDITSRGTEASRFALASVVLIAFSMLVLVLAILHRCVSRPVCRVVGYIVAMNRTNDLNSRIQDSTTGELGTLVSEFNRMLDRLSDDNERRKEAENQLRRAEEKYRRMFEDSVVGIFQSTPDGRYLSANDALARIYAYESAEELLAAVKRIDQQVYVDPVRWAAFTRQIEDHGTVSGFESQAHRRDGAVCWISERARAVRGEGGQVLFYEGMVEDITQRKLADEEVRKLSCAVDQSPASILITDLKGQIVYVNRKFEEVSGYQAAEVLGQRPSLLKSGHMAPDVYRNLWDSITAGQEWHGELHNRGKNGELYWEYASISPILDEKYVITHFLAVKEDITARKASENTLRRTMDQLERFNRLAIGREKRIIELKAVVNELLERLGEAPRYQLRGDPVEPRWESLPERVST